MITHAGRPYVQAGPIIEDIAEFQPASSRGDSDLLYQFRQDQIYTEPVNDDAFVMFDGYKIYTGYKWPFSTTPIPLDDKDWLLDMWDETKAPGVGAMLYIKFKEHTMMDCIPLYLSNPAFMAEHGEELKEVSKKLLSGKIRNDVLYRYQRLLQTFPIMFETMQWLDEYWQDFFGCKMFRFGISNAFAFIKPENVTAELVHESIKNARANASKRLVPPSSHAYIQMYELLIAQEGGADLVEAAEIVTIGLLSWKLARRYIKEKSMSFNDALSICMTFIYKRGTDSSPYENHSLVSSLYDEYGSSDQWPTFDHVIRYVNAVTSGRAQKTQPTPQVGSLDAPPASILANRNTTYD